MNGDLKPYTEYKESGLLWPSHVPGHWDVSQARHIGRLFKAIGGTKEDATSAGVSCVRYGEMYTTYNYVIRASKGFISPERVSSYTPIQYGDVLFAASGETIEDIGKSAVNLIPVMAVCGGDIIVLRPSIPVHSPFLGYAMDSRPAANQKARMGRGTTVKHIYPDELKSLVVPLPPLDEQEAIVRFIRHLDQRVNQLITAKRELIELLNEQKQAVISRAVTRGLDPTVPLKPSGVDWLGNIPSHWQVKPIKRLYREVDERSVTGEEELLSVSHLTGVTPRRQKTITMFMAASYAGHKLCRPDDLVANTMWMWMGALGISGVSGIVSPSYAVYRPRVSAPIMGLYVDLLLRTKRYVNEYTKLSTGIRPSRLRLYPEQFLRLPMLVPPLNEQVAIYKQVSEATCDINSALIKVQAEIDLIREYRTRLVSDVVTGQLDVRHLDLPDVDEEPVDLIDEGDDSDELAGDDLAEAAV